jgi:uncharacterized protein
MKIFFVFLLFEVTLALGENLRIHRIDKLGPGSTNSPRFDHKEARAEAKKVFAELALEHQWEFTQASDSDIFTDEGLRNIDVIIFDNNSGMMLSEFEKQSFEKWMHNGGGVVGIHGASHAHKGVDESNEAEWEFWYGLWGVLHKTGPKEGPKGRRGYNDWINMVDDQGNWTQKVPKRWLFEKVEWYFWNYHHDFPEVQVIATAEANLNQPDLPVYYPVTWTKEYEGGRVWYTNMGHYAENFHQKEFIQHLLDGIRWAGEGNAPNPEKQKLQGNWEGHLIGHEEGEKITLTISGDSLHFHRDEEFWFKTIFTLPSDTSPKQLHTKIKDCADSGIIGEDVFAIYKIEHGTLFINTGGDSVEALPENFESDGATLYRFKKVQAEVK